MAFKFKNTSSICTKDNSLSIWGTLQSKVQDEFMNTFKYEDGTSSTKIYCEYIEEITYKNKVLYKKGA